MAVLARRVLPMTTPRPPCSVLRRNCRDSRSVPAEELFRWIGHSEKCGTIASVNPVGNTSPPRVSW